MFIQKCICHSLHLCASAACKTLPRVCEDLAHNIFNYFKSSSKRICQFKEFQEFCNVSPHQILRPSQTRWLSLFMVVTRIVEQWNALKLFFTSNWYEHKLKSTEEIHKTLHDPSIFIYFNFLQSVLPKFVNLNKLFQSDRPVLCLVYNKMKELYLDLLYSYMRKCNNPTSIDPSDSAYFLPLKDIYLGSQVMALMNKPDIIANEIMVQDILERCRKFLITSCIQIKMRFDFENPILHSLGQLNPNQVLSDNRSSTLLPFIQQFPVIIKKYNNIQEIDDGWRKLSIIDLDPEVINDLRQLNVENFWIQLKIFKKNDEFPFEIISKFILTVLSLPQSNVACERLFSKVNLIKTKSRNRLQTLSLNGLLNSSQHMQETACYKFEPTKKMYSLMTSNNLYSNNDDNSDDDEITFVNL